MIVLTVAYESNRAMTLDIHNMSRVIQVKTSELNEDFSTLKQAFSMAKLGMHHCQFMRTCVELNANLSQMTGSVDGCQHQIHLQTIMKHALSGKLRLAIGSSRAAISQSGKRIEIPFSGYMVFPGAARQFYAPQ